MIFQARTPYFLCLIAVVMGMLAGCSSTVRMTSPPKGNPPVENPSAGNPPEAMPAPNPGDTYDYEASNDNCQCKEYTAKDRLGVEYTFTANYRIDTMIVTNIVIHFRNNGKDTLTLDPGVVKISSKNVSYQHNDKFLPLPDMKVPPGKEDKLELTGRDLAGSESEWNKIAGEQLTITLKGMHLGRKALAMQKVTFIPENPLMRSKE